MPSETPLPLNIIGNLSPQAPLTPVPAKHYIMGFIVQEPGFHVEWQTFAFTLDLTLGSLMTKMECLYCCNFTCVIKSYFFISWFIFLANWFPGLHIFIFSGSLLRFNLNFCVLDDPDPDDGFNYKQMMVRDERRFKMADKDGDLIATKEEFTAFLHPEEYDYMKDIVVQVGESQDSQQNLRFSLWCLCCLSTFAFPLHLEEWFAVQVLARLSLGCVTLFFCDLDQVVYFRCLRLSF